MNDTDHKRLSVHTVTSSSVMSWFVLMIYALLLCSTLICSLPVSHLGSEDTDAVHPHQSNWQTFTETSPSCNFPIPPPFSRLLLSATSFCSLSVSVSSFSTSSFIPQSLSLLPFSCPLHLSFHQSSQSGLLCWIRGRLGNMAAVPVHLHPPSCFPAAVFVLWQLVATFWPQRVHSAEYTSAHMQNTLSTQKKWTGKHAETGAATHTHGCTGKHSNRQTCIRRHKHSQYIYYTQTHHSAVLSGQSLFGRRRGGG